MLLSQFTLYELKHFREVCNFTDQELEYFNLKAKNNSNIKIASEILSIK